jgi:hypothetical protein
MQQLEAQKLAAGLVLKKAEGASKAASEQAHAKKVAEESAKEKKRQVRS